MSVNERKTLEDITENKNLAALQAELDAERERLAEERRRLEDIKAEAGASKEAAEKAAENAAKSAEKAKKAGQGTVKSIKGFIKGLILGLILGAVCMFFIGKALEPKPHTSDETDPMDGEVIEEHLTGYTAIDFQNAILGEAKEHQELIVMEQPIQYSTTLYKEGPWEWEVFRRTKGITYHGTGVYTVDLSKIKNTSIVVDEMGKRIVVTVPHAALQYVNPDYDKIEFEDTEKGFLAFGDIKLTAEQQNELEKTVKEEMTALLQDKDILASADDFAEMKIWDLFQPLVTAVSPEFRVEIKFI